MMEQRRTYLKYIFADMCGQGMTRLVFTSYWGFSGFKIKFASDE
jgi:hypothetical protein